MAARQTIERARKFRREMTAVEWRLWRSLRNRQLNGYRFRRQHPIGVYVADFACLERRLVIEIDGDHHSEPRQIAHDARRTSWLQNEGYLVLRFWANEIDENLNAVLDRILAELEQRPSP